MARRSQNHSTFPHLRALAFLLGFASVGFLSHGQTFTISGRVTDQSTGEYILGANVVNTSIGKGIATNAYGFFSMTLPQGSTTLTCSFIGYEPVSKTFEGTRDEEWNVALTVQAVEMDAAEVVGTAGQNTQSTNLGKAEVAIATIQRLPALMG